MFIVNLQGEVKAKSDWNRRPSHYCSDVTSIQSQFGFSFGDLQYPKFNFKIRFKIHMTIQNKSLRFYILKYSYQMLSQIVIKQWDYSPVVKSAVNFVK